uniref:Uncharacterized protein n=1 Tax=Trichuris muris TaxID=70415 RepID=A0A5S6QMA4_TRIMR
MDDRCSQRTFGQASGCTGSGEDGTLRSVSELLCSTREMWNRGDVAGARRLLNDLEFKRKNDTDDEVAPRSSSNNDSMDTTSYPVNETQPEEDGWTIVRSRRSMKR